MKFATLTADIQPGTQTDRNFGLDLCRILSMLGIVMLHILGHGGVLSYTEATKQSSHWIAYWVEIIVMCSVDVFAVLSGYFGYGKQKQKSYRMWELISVVVFYSVIITAALYVVNPLMFTGVKALLKSLAESLEGPYWYIVCFVPILAFQPLLNKMLASLSEKQHNLLSCILFALFSIIPSFIPIDFFKTFVGYSCAWLLICYIFGANLRRSGMYQQAKQHKALAITVFFVLSAILLFGNYLCELLFHKHGYCISYVSPFTLLMAFALITAFDGIKCVKGKKVIRFFSAMSFDVYIIHSNILIFDYYIKDAFIWIGKLNILLIPIAALMSACVIYLFSAVVAWLRTLFYRITGSEKLISKFSLYYDKFFNKFMTEREEKA